MRSEDCRTQDKDWFVCLYLTVRMHTKTTHTLPHVDGFLLCKRLEAGVSESSRVDAQLVVREGLRTMGFSCILSLVVY